MSQKPWVKYGVAVVAAVAGLLLRLAFASQLHHNAPYLTFLLMTFVSAVFGGFGPGLVTTILGGLLAAVFVISPVPSIQSLTRADYVGVVIFSGIGAFISYLSGRLITAKRQENATRLVFQQTLLSIGDAVISIDPSKRILLMNGVAEQLTGSSDAQAKGRQLASVFRVLVDGGVAGAQVSVDQVIDEVLHSGVSARLPNRCELLSVDGRHIPIDDSVSPIRNKSGEIVGAVLVFRDVTERKRNEQNLLRLNEDLKQFTYAASHDLKEPLRMMTLYMQMFERKYRAQLNDEGRSYLSQVSKGAERISRLIEGLLQFSRSGEVSDIQPAPVDAAAALKDALEDLQLLVTSANGHVTTGILPIVMADRSHLYQLFQNLVGNAIKYRKPDVRPQIHISAEPSGDKWVFAVRDNGIGVPAAYHAQIFTPFKRLHGSEIAGAGIGLATCKRIVELYGGCIWVESQPMNGSVFYFSLPAAQQHPTAQQHPI